MSFFNLLQRLLRAFWHGLRDVPVWTFQPGYWLICIKNWIIKFSNSSSPLFYNTNHLVVRCIWIITGDVMLIIGLEWGTVSCIRGLYLICLGRSANDTEGNITLHTRRHTDILVCSQMSSVWAGLTKENSAMISECVPEPTATKPGWEPQHCTPWSYQWRETFLVQILKL